MTERTEAQWEIYRFELVFFNSRYGHWQLFGEKQGEDEGRTSDRASFYRQEIQSLLRSVRNAFYNESTLGVANGARSRMRVVDLPREGIRSSKIGVKFSEALKRRRGELTQRSIDLTLNALVEYYVRRTEEEALPPSVADRLTSFIRNILSAERESKEDVELTLSEALDLLSIVSPLEEWDVFGSAEKATHRVWKNGEWRRLFAYKISYPAMPKGTLPRENEDMGYPVILEICADCLTTGFDDATVRGAGGIPKEEGDYFEYCPKPKQVEGIIYDLYGLIVDELQQRSGEDVYIIAYPIIACGFYHFLQIYARPLNADLSTACDLLRSFRHWHGENERSFLTDLNIFKESIRELLIQIRIAAFQISCMTDGKAIKDDASSRSPVDTFCAHAHHLVALRSISVNAPNCVWMNTGYAPEEGLRKLIRSWSRIDNQVSIEREDERRVTIENMIFSLEWAMETPYFKTWLFRETSRQRLEQQFQWWKAILEMTMKRIGSPNVGERMAE